MAKRVDNFLPVRYPSDRHTETGKLAVAAKRGMVVCHKAAAGADGEVELATGKAGFFLTRDVVSAADLKTFHEGNMLRPDKEGFQSPFVINGHVQAEDLDSFWVEGADVLGASMDADAPIGASVTTAAGKIVLLEDSEAEECLGIIRDKVAAVNAASPAKRFLIQVVRAPMNVPAE